MIAKIQLQRLWVGKGSWSRQQKRRWKGKVMAEATEVVLREWEYGGEESGERWEVRGEIKNIIVPYGSQALPGELERINAVNLLINWRSVMADLYVQFVLHRNHCWTWFPFSSTAISTKGGNNESNSPQRQKHKRFQPLGKKSISPLRFTVKVEPIGPAYVETYDYIQIMGNFSSHNFFHSHVKFDAV
jgi:hypothetical protein